MRSKFKTSRINLSFWTPSRIVFSGVILTSFIVSGFCAIQFSVSLLLQPVSISPTSLPWIKSEAECKHTNRMWENGKCWDDEHGITF